MMIDRERLLKFLRLTESGHDGEAMAAMRMANKLIRSAGKTWEDVVAGVAAPAPKSYGSPAPTDYRTPPSKRGTRQHGRADPRSPKTEAKRIYDDNIGTYLKELTKRRHDPSTVMFLASLSEYYEAKGYLTEPQYETVMRMHHRKRGKSAWRFFALSRAFPCFTYFGRPSRRSYGRTALGMLLQ
ncbi:hypothetical protein [Bradyrhizobium sp. RT7b]|uniref:hypothetical protein n=1 Tax=unclassified Bradyrhizobium TaxID=2631580 RepID=UPI0033983E35